LKKNHKGSEINNDKGGVVKESILSNPGRNSGVLNKGSSGTKTVSNSTRPTTTIRQRPAKENQTSEIRVEKRGTGSNREVTFRGQRESDKQPNGASGQPKVQKSPVVTLPETIIRLLLRRKDIGYSFFFSITLL
jgi:hypothetical protein